MSSPDFAVLALHRRTVFFRGYGGHSHNGMSICVGDTAPLSSVPALQVRLRPTHVRIPAQYKQFTDGTQAVDSVLLLENLSEHLDDSVIVGYVLVDASAYNNALRTVFGLINPGPTNPNARANRGDVFYCSTGEKYVIISRNSHIHTCDLKIILSSLDNEPPSTIGKVLGISQVGVMVFLMHSGSIMNGSCCQ